MIVAASSTARSRAIQPSSLHEVHRRVALRPGHTIALHVGEPHLGIPSEVSEAFVEAIRGGQSHYCDSQGLPILREKLSERFAAKAGVDVPVDRIFVTPGSCQAIAATLLSVAFEGGVALLPEIHWPMHLQQIMMAGLRPVFYPMKRGEALIEALEAAQVNDACVMIVNSPSNPSGEVMDADTERRVYEWARRRRVCIISDEAYEDFIFEGQPSTMLQLDAAAPPAERIVFSIHTFSKSYSLTGYRLGYVTAPTPERADLLGRVQQATLVAPSTPVQFAGLAALRQERHVQLHHDYVRQTRDAVSAALSGTGLIWKVPQGGWYVLLDLSAHTQDAATFCHALLDEVGLGLAPGATFGRPGHAMAARLARMAICREREYTLRGVGLLQEYLHARR
jgi:aspartate/methionine/tyrosine aminotransferase